MLLQDQTTGKLAIQRALFHVEMFMCFPQPVTAGYRFPHFLLQVLDNAIETEKMIEKYESLASDLLEWIEQTIIILNNRKFANSLVGVQQQLQAFNTYRTVEKPPK